MNKNNLQTASAPIGIFDSGLGGLTVVQALQKRLPRETLIYFGDTARVPYGTKSPRTVLGFARQCLRFLMQMNPKLLVVACNTVSATALDVLPGEFAVPVIGVLEPGAAAAVQAARKIRNAGECTVGLIATEATIASNAYATAIARLDPQIHVIGRACPLLVPMIEEGRPADNPVVQAVLAEYLGPIKALNPTAMILGCTHYPIYASVIGRSLGSQTQLIDSADQTALAAAQKLSIMGLLNSESESGGLTCYVTDQGQRFESVASRFLGGPIGQPVWVDPELLETTPLEQT
ncbi:MAG TPA: glutamate racemase [Phycisphaerae bacterium]|nr:glutamate racemase [Phycisphaerae bacterium]